MTTKQPGSSQKKSRRGGAPKNQTTATEPSSSQSAPQEKVSPQETAAPPAAQRSAASGTPKSPAAPQAAPSEPARAPEPKAISTEKPIPNAPLTPALPRQATRPQENKPAAETPSANKPFVSLGDALEAMKAEVPIAKAAPDVLPGKSSGVSKPESESKPPEKTELPKPAAPGPKPAPPASSEPKRDVQAGAPAKKDVTSVVPNPDLGRELKRVEAQTAQPAARPVSTEKPAEEKKETPKAEKIESKADVVRETPPQAAKVERKSEEPPKVAQVESKSPPATEEKKQTGETPVPLEEPSKTTAQPEPVPFEPQPELERIEPLKPEPTKAEEQMPAPPAQSAPQAPPPPPPRPRVQPVFVMMVTPELAPVAKVGGLADVVFGLSRELEIRGNAVEIILPKYDCMKYNHIWGLSVAYDNLQVPWFGGAIHTTVWFGFVHGRKCFFIDPHSADNFFNRGVFYGQNDDVLRFAFFCRAAMEFMFKSGKHPEIIHCHDWQTGLVPVLLWEMYQHLGMRHPRVCFTIHNFKHQGMTGEQVLRATGLHRPEHFFNYDRMRDNNNPHALNLLKSGIVYSNFVTTVSPRYAWEAKDGGQGFGLEPTLHIHHGKYGGVLNGLDYEMFNPDTDRHIPAHYNVQTIEKKYDNKRALRNRLWLADNEKPIVAFIGRLDPQKGPELVKHAIFYALQHRAQFVLLGESPDRAINNDFWGLKRHLNDSPDCHLEIGYSDELAHLIYAGADMMIVPSRFEPCGLTQLISLRYGTVPIVRAVGGLADTVFDKDYSPRPLHERNGYVFHNADNAGIESALNRAISCYYQFPDHFRHLMVNAMNSDYSWNHPGEHYVNIYDYIKDK